MSTSALDTPSSSNAHSPGHFDTSRTYTDRDTKAAWIADTFRSILTTSVLDVGCDRARLRTLLGPGVRYLGVDVAPGAADLVINLDRDPLPLRSRAFHAVVCTDVLEHLDRCHAVFDELCRVADRFVLISLPNPVRDMLLHLSERHTESLRHYGLPAEPPADRHRWFFNSEEAEAFVRARADANGFTIAHMHFEPGGLPSWHKSGGPNILTTPAVLRGTMWAVLERRP